MYQIENSGQVLRARQEGRRRGLSWPRVSQTVLLLGLTSMFTDISAEMVSTILPMYLVLSLQLSPLAFGVIDGLYLGAAAIVRLISGVLADRSHRHKHVAVAGYALSALSRLGMLVVGGVWTLLATVVLVDRLGKGIRTAPRDAMISLTTEPGRLGTAFGVHRAMDTAGAMIGPLLAFLILAVAPGAYDAIFLVSLCAAIVGLAILGLFVENPRARPPAGSAPEETSRPSMRLALARARDARFGAVLVVGTVLSLATMSDGFLYLTLQRQVSFNAGFFPLLYVATAVIFMLLAIPMGQLADRFGRGRVFVGGYVLLLAVYGVLLAPWHGAVQVGLALLLLGASYAATDGVLMALAGGVLPEHLRASGMALLTTLTNVARLLSSILFGMLWTWQGLTVAIWIFAGLLLLAVVLALRLLHPTAQPGGANAA